MNFVYNWLWKNTRQSKFINHKPNESLLIKTGCVTTPSRPVRLPPHDDEQIDRTEIEQVTQMFRVVKTAQ